MQRTLRPGKSIETCPTSGSQTESIRRGSKSFEHPTRTLDISGSLRWHRLELPNRSIPEPDPNPECREEVANGNRPKRNLVEDKQARLADHGSLRGMSAISSVTRQGMNSCRRHRSSCRARALEDSHASRSGGSVSSDFHRIKSRNPLWNKEKRVLATGFQPVVSLADRRDALSALTAGTAVFPRFPPYHWISTAISRRIVHVPQAAQ